MTLAAQIDPAAYASPPRIVYRFEGGRLSEHETQQ